MDELIDLLNKEEVFETEKKIEKALAKSVDEKSKVEAAMIDSKNILENAESSETEDRDKHILKAPTTDEGTVHLNGDKLKAPDQSSFKAAVPPISPQPEKKNLKDSTL